MGSKTHFMSAFRNWVNWNLEFLEDPFEFNPIKICYWLQTRTEELNGIKSLNQWTGAINWICEIKGENPTYKDDTGYIKYISSLKKLYKEGKDARLPFKLKHIKNYIKSLWKHDEKGRKISITYRNLIKASLAATYFCTMSRPSEIAKSIDADDELRGVTLGDYHCIHDKQNNMYIMNMVINLFKNQQTRKMKKQIYFASTSCTHKKGCACEYVNPYNLIKRMLRRRKGLVDTLKSNLSRGDLRQKTKEILQKKLEGLNFKSTNFLFVHEDGRPVAPSYVSQIAKEIAKKARISDSQHYTAYSFRIGGTTRAYLVGLNKPKILLYVGWSMNRLSDCSQRYIRYDPATLATVPFYMIHPKQKVIDKGQIYDPWSEGLDKKYYNQQ